jgi:hypothetical protein
LTDSDEKSANAWLRIIESLRALQSEPKSSEASPRSQALD